MNVSRKFPQSRLRRTRFTASTRSLVAENSLSVDDLIQPVFVKEDLDGIESIDSLPGINRYGLNALDAEIEKIQTNKIKAVAVFPVINPDKKDEQGSDSLNEDNLVCTAIKQIKKKVPTCKIEVLTPDFQGNWESLKLVTDENPETFNHNIETVKRVFPRVRAKGDYNLSLTLLDKVKDFMPGFSVDI